ncbi:MAG: DUF2283 domain-containing protein [Nitrospiraceae bacterium]|nr:DUF2283 domain-containing protein [Nitrospiraceae bacterium]
MDKEVDALYIRIQEKEPAARRRFPTESILTSMKRGRLIGLEILNAVECYSLADIFNLSTENLVLEKT